MFSVLIVDDKKSIRDGLKEFVDWPSLGFRVDGDFSSAAEAIRYIEDECVDVLLTDIVMPDVTGLELIKEVKLINPHIKVIILSAYEKFEFAQEAVKLGAFSYLTKPVDLEKLTAEFINIRHILEKELIENQQRKEFKDFAKEQFLNNLVNGFYNSSENILKRASELNLRFDSATYCILRIVIEKSSSTEKEPDETDFHQLISIVTIHLEACLKEYGTVYVFNSNLSEVTAIFFPTDRKNLKNYLEKYLEDIHRNLHSDLFIGVGRAYDGIMNVVDSFYQAGKALEYRIIKKNSPILFYEEVVDIFKGKSLITAAMEDTIISHLSLQNEDELKEFILNIIADAYKVGQANSRLLYNACIEVLLIINKFLTANEEYKKNIEQNNYSSLKSLLLKQTFQEIQAFILEYLKGCFIIIRNNNEKSAGLIIEKAKKYIQEHYSEEITLNKLSKVVYVNPIYLSRLFKEKMGENFIDYLTKIRIDQAKKLLEDVSLRIYDITEMVGYESRKHFGKTFKEITGMSPKDYRDKMVLPKNP